MGGKLKTFLGLMVIATAGALTGTVFPFPLQGQPPVPCEEGMRCDISWQDCRFDPSSVCVWFTPSICDTEQECPE